MSFELQEAEPVPRAVRRLAIEQNRKAAGLLRDESGDLHERIHEARKCFKKIRAVLRLARAGLDDVRADENRWYRDAGRALGSGRDAQAMVESLDLLGDGCREADERRVSAVRDWLVQRRSRIAHDQSELPQTAARIGAELPGARRRIDQWPLNEDSFQVLAPGLSRTFKQLRSTFDTARACFAPETFHAWRKRTKDHWYHVRILVPIWPPVMKGYGRALKELSSVLGDEHDLTVLRQTVIDEGDSVLDRATREWLLGRIAICQRDLRIEAINLGRRVAAEKPKALRRRLHGCFEAWRAAPPRVTADTPATDEGQPSCAGSTS